MLTIEKLTEREKEVLALIKKDATISREEIANKLKISESAVGTYIHHLSTKGYLLGRGYITAPEQKVVIVGGANLDIKGYSPNYIKGSSSPGWIKESSGGVGRNIAEDLALLEQEVVLLTAVSSDHFGDQLKVETEAVGVDISHFKTTQAQDYKTGVYLAHMDQNGDLIGAVNDMRILKEIDSNYLNNKRKIIETSSMLIFDTNLEENIISFLLELVKDKKMIKITDAVSVEKSLKLKGKLTELDYLRANLDEAEVILDIVNIVKMEDSESAQKMDLEARLERLKREYSRNKELPEMIISAGQNGVYYLSQSEGETELRHFEAVKVSSNEIVETTGAGDALTAGFAAGIMNEMSINEAIKLGIKASALTVKSELTCSPDLSKLV
ncbi:MAG: PfkB domain-containing protein [Halanaerobium sp. 4-GBenrich]|uniref:Pseudouridine kinase n=1 Tax=Halanaerobium congolense TaxID=54121 RepID=A0A1G6JI52_9FIRM|nr:PfkB family carbohydrate kinase [Halanaerobium congolense]KXS48319.1 MAG: PfkB domain-containing protein [Halanaerobium sp. T82-1]ODS50532.1 MAG: PfkB domain-containing protein [Halanaerobium sp. 4-GBenrich]PTX16224.1 pseudouridine kinase [Halanaerobium congolense]TDP25875.1 pseudouridine kinase [Halanaerobium congolense]SDC18393.1 pseudouridine kinase [Halanaerobium congolense]